MRIKAAIFSFIICFLFSHHAVGQLKVHVSYSFYGNASLALEKYTYDTILSGPFDYFTLDKIYNMGMESPKYGTYSLEAKKSENAYANDHSIGTFFVNQAPYNMDTNNIDTNDKEIIISRSESGYVYPFCPLKYLRFDQYNRITSYSSENKTPEGSNTPWHYCYYYNDKGQLTSIINKSNDYNLAGLSYDIEGRLIEVIVIGDSDDDFYNSYQKMIVKFTYSK